MSVVTVKQEKPDEVTSTVASSVTSSMIPGVRAGVPNIITIPASQLQGRAGGTITIPTQIPGATGATNVITLPASLFQGNRPRGPMQLVLPPGVTNRGLSNLIVASSAGRTAVGTPPVVFTTRALTATTTSMLPVARSAALSSTVILSPSVAPPVPQVAATTVASSSPFAPTQVIDISQSNNLFGPPISISPGLEEVDDSTVLEDIFGPPVNISPSPIVNSSNGLQSDSSSMPVILSTRSLRSDDSSSDFGLINGSGSSSQPVQSNSGASGVNGIDDPELANAPTPICIEPQGNVITIAPQEDDLATATSLLRQDDPGSLPPIQPQVPVSMPIRNVVMAPNATVPARHTIRILSRGNRYARDGRVMVADGHSKTIVRMPQVLPNQQQRAPRKTSLSTRTVDKVIALSDDSGSQASSGNSSPQKGDKKENTVFGLMRFLMRPVSGSMSTVKEFYCNFCLVRTENEQAFMDHIASHLFVCGLCSYQTFSRIDMVGHIIREHPSDKSDLGKLHTMHLENVTLKGQQNIVHKGNVDRSKPQNWSNVLAGKDIVGPNASKSSTPTTAMPTSTTPLRMPGVGNSPNVLGTPGVTALSSPLTNVMGLPQSVTSAMTGSTIISSASMSQLLNEPPIPPILISTTSVTTPLAVTTMASSSNTMTVSTASNVTASGDKFLCSFCGFQANDDRTVAIHEQVHIREKQKENTLDDFQVICLYCLLSKKSIHQMSSHMRLFHKNSPMKLIYGIAAQNQAMLWFCPICAFWRHKKAWSEVCTHLSLRHNNDHCPNKDAFQEAYVSACEDLSNFLKNLWMSGHDVEEQDIALTSAWVNRIKTAKTQDVDSDAALPVGDGDLSNSQMGVEPAPAPVPSPADENDAASSTSTLTIPDNSIDDFESQDGTTNQLSSDPKSLTNQPQVPAFSSVGGAVEYFRNSGVTTDIIEKIVPHVQTVRTFNFSKGELNINPLNYMEFTKPTGTKKCKICTGKLCSKTTSTAVEEHVYHHFKIHLWECASCGLRRSTRHDVVQHMVAIHPDSPLIIRKRQPVYARPPDSIMAEEDEEAQAMMHNTPVIRSVEDIDYAWGCPFCFRKDESRSVMIRHLHLCHPVQSFMPNILEQKALFNVEDDEVDQIKKKIRAPKVLLVRVEDMDKFNPSQKRLKARYFKHVRVSGRGKINVSAFLESDPAGKLWCYYCNFRHKKVNAVKDHCQILHDHQEPIVKDMRTSMHIGKFAKRDRLIYMCPTCEFFSVSRKATLLHATKNPSHYEATASEDLQEALKEADTLAASRSVRNRKSRELFQVSRLSDRKYKKRGPQPVVVSTPPRRAVAKKSTAKPHYVPFGEQPGSPDIRLWFCLYCREKDGSPGSLKKHYYDKHPEELLLALNSNGQRVNLATFPDEMATPADGSVELSNKNPLDGSYQSSGQVSQPGNDAAPVNQSSDSAHSAVASTVSDQPPVSKNPEPADADTEQSLSTRSDIVPIEIDPESESEALMSGPEPIESESEVEESIPVANISPVDNLEQTMDAIESTAESVGQESSQVSGGKESHVASSTPVSSASVGTLATPSDRTDHSSVTNTRHINSDQNEDFPKDKTLDSSPTDASSGNKTISIEPELPSPTESSLSESVTVAPDSAQPISIEPNSVHSASVDTSVADDDQSVDIDSESHLTQSVSTGAAISELNSDKTISNVSESIETGELASEGGELPDDSSGPKTLTSPAGEESSMPEIIHSDHIEPEAKEPNPALEPDAITYVPPSPEAVPEASESDADVESAFVEPVSKTTECDESSQDPGSLTPEVEKAPDAESNQTSVVDNPVPMETDLSTNIEVATGKAHSKTSESKPSDEQYGSSPNDLKVCDEIPSPKQKLASAESEYNTSSPKPKPAPIELESVTSELGPASNESKSATFELGPAPSESKSAASEPGPAPSESKPATSELGPAPSESKSATSEPGPAPSESKSATSELGPAPSESKSATSVPGRAPCESKSATSELGPAPSESKSATSELRPAPSESKSATTDLGPALNDSESATSELGSAASESKSATSVPGPAASESKSATSELGPAPSESKSATSGLGPAPSESKSATSELGPAPSESKSPTTDLGPALNDSKSATSELGPVADEHATSGLEPEPVNIQPEVIDTHLVSDSSEAPADEHHVPDTSLTSQTHSPKSPSDPSSNLPDTDSESLSSQSDANKTEPLLVESPVTDSELVSPRSDAKKTEPPLVESTPVVNEKTAGSVSDLETVETELPQINTTNQPGVPSRGELTEPDVESIEESSNKSETAEDAEKSEDVKSAPVSPPESSKRDSGVDEQGIVSSEVNKSIGEQLVNDKTEASIPGSTEASLSSKPASESDKPAHDDLVSRTDCTIEQSTAVSPKQVTGDLESQKVSSDPGASEKDGHVLGSVELSNLPSPLTSSVLETTPDALKTPGRMQPTRGAKKLESGPQDTAEPLEQVTDSSVESNSGGKRLSSMKARSRMKSMQERKRARGLGAKLNNIVEQLSTRAHNNEHLNMHATSSEEKTPSSSGKVNEVEPVDTAHTPVITKQKDTVITDSSKSVKSDVCSSTPLADSNEAGIESRNDVIQQEESKAASVSAPTVASQCKPTESLSAVDSSSQVGAGPDVSFDCFSSTESDGVNLLTEPENDSPSRPLSTSMTRNPSNTAETQSSEPSCPDSEMSTLPNPGPTLNAHLAMLVNYRPKKLAATGPINRATPLVSPGVDSESEIGPSLEESRESGEEGNGGEVTDVKASFTTPKVPTSNDTSSASSKKCIAALPSRDPVHAPEDSDGHLTELEDNTQDHAESDTREAVSDSGKSGEVDVSRAENSDESVLGEKNLKSSSKEACSEKGAGNSSSSSSDSSSSGDETDVDSDATEVDYPIQPDEKVSTKDPKKKTSSATVSDAAVSEKTSKESLKQDDNLLNDSINDDANGDDNTSAKVDSDAVDVAQPPNKIVSNVSEDLADASPKSDSPSRLPARIRKQVIPFVAAPAKRETPQHKKGKPPVKRPTRRSLTEHSPLPAEANLSRDSIASDEIITGDHSKGDDSLDVSESPLKIARTKVIGPGSNAKSKKSKMSVLKTMESPAKVENYDPYDIDNVFDDMDDLELPVNPFRSVCKKPVKHEPHSGTSPEGKANIDLNLSDSSPSEAKPKPLKRKLPRRSLPKQSGPGIPSDPFGSTTDTDGESPVKRKRSTRLPASAEHKAYNEETDVDDDSEVLTSPESVAVGKKCEMSIESLEEDMEEDEFDEVVSEKRGKADDTGTPVGSLGGAGIPPGETAAASGHVKVRISKKRFGKKRKKKMPKRKNRPPVAAALILASKSTAGAIPVKVPLEEESTEREVGTESVKNEVGEVIDKRSEASESLSNLDIPAEQGLSAQVDEDAEVPRKTTRNCVRQASARTAAEASTETALEEASKSGDGNESRPASPKKAPRSPKKGAKSSKITTLLEIHGKKSGKKAKLKAHMQGGVIQFRKSKGGKRLTKAERLAAEAAAKEAARKQKYYRPYVGVKSLTSFYKCRYCDWEGNFEYEAKDHVSTKHSDSVQEVKDLKKAALRQKSRLFFCPHKKCDVHTYNQFIYENHKCWLQVSAELMQCGYCNFLTDNKAGLLQHIKVHETTMLAMKTDTTSTASK